MIESFYHLIKMSLLYHKHSKRIIKWIWGIIAVLITISMLATYSGGIGL